VALQIHLCLAELEESKHLVHHTVSRRLAAEFIDLDRRVQVIADEAALHRQNKSHFVRHILAQGTDVLYAQCTSERDKQIAHLVANLEGLQMAGSNVVKSYKK
jgi:hypothetical protein